MKIVVKYLNFVFHIEVKSKLNDKFDEFRFSIYQKHEIALGVHGLVSIDEAIIVIINMNNNNISDFQTRTKQFPRIHTRSSITLKRF